MCCHWHRNYLGLWRIGHTARALPKEVGSLPILRLLVCLVLFPAAIQAQAIVGRVIEDEKRTGIPGAEIELLHAARAARSRTITDSAGTFRLPVRDPGEYWLRVRHLGYTTIDSEPIRVGPAEIVRVEIRMAQTRIPLEPLIVTVRITEPRLAEFHDRRITASSGRFITRSEIERRPVARTTDLLRTIPGVTVVGLQVPGRARTHYLIRMRGAGTTCVPAIYIDGVSVRQVQESMVDDLLQPSAIEGVEVYTSTSSAPARYAVQGTCGVVLFWTRSGEVTAKKWSWKQVIGGATLAAGLITLLLLTK